jgi:gliding motility-associated lipoprotein GldD
MFKRFFFLATALLLIVACGDGDNAQTPKPRGYPRINFPAFDAANRYQKFDANYCQFTFDYPTYANIVRDTLFFDEAPPSDCWFNMTIPSLNATLHCSYYNVSSKNPFDKLRADAFSLAGKHVIKADYINDQRILNPQGVSGFAFDIEGPAACPFQFYVSDSTKHFMRAALYINAPAKTDSLAPIVSFLKEDMGRMLKTFTWKK